MRNNIAVLAGQKGTGKTTLARELVAQAPRVVVIDPMGEYGLESGCSPVWGFEAACEALLDAEPRSRFRLSLRSEDTDDLLDLLGLAWDMPGILLTVEEATLFCGPTTLPPEISRLLRYGRHRAIDQLYVTQRIAEISRTMTALADHVITFRQTEPGDLDHLRRRGFDPLAVMALGVDPRDPRKSQVLAVGDRDALPWPVVIRLRPERAPQLPLDERAEPDLDSAPESQLEGPEDES